MKKLLFIIISITIFPIYVFSNDNKSEVITTYYDNGVLKEEIPYINGVINGVVKSFHENGALYIEDNYLNDKKDGMQKIYSNKGILLQETIFVNDIKQGFSKRYFDNGSLYIVIKYENNKAVDGNCATGRKLTKKELNDIDNGLKVICE